MKLTSFSIRNDDLVGFGVGSTGISYCVHFDIEVWHENWEKEGITIGDFLNKKAYIIAPVRNINCTRMTQFIKGVAR